MALREMISVLLLFLEQQDQTPALAGIADSAIHFNGVCTSSLSVHW